jgi:hypothetical protein
MPGKEREHTPHRQQMPSDRLNIKQLPLPISLTLHNHRISGPARSPHHDARIVQQAPSVLSGDSAEYFRGSGIS